MSLFLIAAAARAAPSGKKGTAFHWLVSLGAPGVFGVSVVDASVVPLAIPGSTDLLLLWVISRGGNPYLMVGFALAGTVLGGWTTWRLGKKGGEAAIKRYVPQRLQTRVAGWSQKHPMLMVFLPAILPPPIPLAPFLLAAGAMGASWRRFLAAFGTGRLLRYGLVGWLAAAYGRRVTRVYAATLEKYGPPVLWAFIALTVMGTVFSVWRFRHQRIQPEGTRPGPSRSDQPEGNAA